MNKYVQTRLIASLPSKTHLLYFLYRRCTATSPLPDFQSQLQRRCSATSVRLCNLVNKYVETRLIASLPSKTHLLYFLYRRCTATSPLPDFQSHLQRRCSATSVRLCNLVNKYVETRHCLVSHRNVCIIQIQKRQGSALSLHFCSGSLSVAETPNTLLHYQLGSSSVVVYQVQTLRQCRYINALGVGNGIR